MIHRTNINFADFSGGDLNPVIRGRNCPVSPGCAHCYVERDFNRYGKEMLLATTIYPEKLRRLGKADFTDHGKPFRRGPGSRPIAFPCDYGDLFHDDVPEGFIMEAFLIMSGHYEVDWAVFTKRPARLKRMVDYFCTKFGPFPSNIWTIASVEDQERANERGPILMATQSVVKGFSVEPMLESIDLRFYLNGCPRQTSYRQYVTRDMALDAGYPEMEGTLYFDDEWEQTTPPPSWVICGAESGPDRREFRKEWAADLYAQCQAAGVPFFFKQGPGLHPGEDRFLGSNIVEEFPK